MEPTVSWLRKLETNAEICSQAHKKQAGAFLWHSEIASINQLSFYSIAHQPEPSNLIPEEVHVALADHSRHILDDESLRLNDLQRSHKFAIEEIDVAVRISHTRLAEALTGVAADQQIGLGKGLDPPDIIYQVVGIGKIRQVHVTRVWQNVICHEYLKPGSV